MGVGAGTVVVGGVATTVVLATGGSVVGVDAGELGGVVAIGAELGVVGGVVVAGSPAPD